MKKNHKWLVLTLILIGIAILSLYILDKKKTEHSKTISIVSIVKIDPITQLEDGFKKQILESEFAQKDSIKITYDNAQGDASLQNQIVDKIIRQKPDLVYVLGTPLAQALQKRDSSLVIVQGTVTDPIAAGLANSWENPGKNYAATTDLPPIALQINLIRDLIPNVQSLGVIYNTGEVNSVAVIKRIREYIVQNNLNIKLEERPISNTSELATITQSLKNKVQAIYIPPDNTVHAGLKVVCKIANNNKTPVFATVESSIEDGALVALSLDFFKLGQQSADIALLILEKKKKAGEIPIVPNENPNIYINGSILKMLNLDLNTITKYKNVEVK
ncbi:MAG: ABC transporter substrate-binding protein [Chitinophagales bacterium]|nr:ABC transporter substrate-binding protein [Chitinophagales bacterium]